MNAKKHFTIPFVVMMTLLIAIMLQGFFPMVKMKPLNGFTDEITKDTLTFKKCYNGTYQNFLTSYAKQRTGFREFFIRCYNQAVYTCFGKITNSNIVKGSNNEFYLTMYLNDITGKKLIWDLGSVENAKADAVKNVEETLEFINIIKQRGTDFLFVFCPSKTAVYPEYMPQPYKDEISDFQLIEYYIKLFEEKGIPYIDFYHYFQQIKDEFPYPLYAQTGTHWAESTIPFVCDSLFRKIEEVTGKAMPSIEILDWNLTTDYSGSDSELEDNLNLLFPFRKPAIPQPEFTLKDTIGKDRINLLLVGDSYFKQLKNSCFVNAFNEWDYWIYNRDIYSSRPFYNGKHMNMILTANEVIEDSDLIIAMFTTSFMSKYMFGFIPFAEEQLRNGGISDEEAIALIINNIKSNPEWYQKVVEQAKERGITVEENLLDNADYVLRTNKQKHQEMSKQQ
jgi:hypothetical protein